MFLRSLVDKGMLKYDIEIKDWTWNNMEVNAKDVTNNVANILVDKLNRLGESQKNILMIAGSLGGCFAKSIICTIVTSLSEKDTDQLDWHETLSSIDESIDELEKEGILEKDTNENVWRFSHDRIQLAAFQLIPPNDRDSFRGEIGNILLEQLDDDALEANLFKVVSLRNFAMATISDDDDRRGLAQMNLRAGMKVIVLSSSFGISPVYLLLSYTFYLYMYHRHPGMQRLIQLLLISKLAVQCLGQMVGVLIKTQCSHCQVRLPMRVSSLVIMIQCTS